MTLAQVNARVEMIRGLADQDYEVAHGEEDKLHQDVLRAIADGECENPAELARTALETTTIQFARYCA